MVKKNKLPSFQFPGQVIVDSYGVVYSYDESTDCFVEMGSIEEIPDASFDNSGLMLAQHKGKLDNIPDKSGGFALIIKPLKRDISNNNQDGLIYGGIKLISDSIDIQCLDVNGRELSSQCYNCIDGEEPPGLNFQLNEKFLQSFCARLPIIPGPRGDKGETGDRGEPGTGDGPKGVQGAQGESFSVPGTFTGVKTLEVDGVYSSAVVALDLDQASGVLSLTKSRIFTGDSNQPADQVATSYVYRDVEFSPIFPKCEDDGDVFNYTIIKGDDDYKADLDVYRLPDRFQVGDSAVSVIALGRLIDAIIDEFRKDYDAAVAKYDAELKELILTKDEEARRNLCALSRQLSDCEWQMPLEYCIGITPSNCNSAMAKQTQAIQEQTEQLLTVGPFAPYCELVEKGIIEPCLPEE